MPRPIILFDLDGTVIDSTEAILESFRVAFGQFGHMIPADESIKNEIGDTLENMFLTLGVDSKKVDEHVQAYKMYYRTIHCQKTYLLDGARDAIKKASRFATLGVVTTKTGKYSREILEHLGLMNYFEVLIGREHVTHPKPDSEPILKALENIEHNRNRVWMIGDTPMDILSANNAGVNSVAVTSGYASYQELEKCASQICDNILSAVNFIQNSVENYK